MKTFSFIAFSLTLLLAFCLWLPNELSFTILWLSTAFLAIPLLIADIVAFVYLVRHRKDKGSKGLVLLLVAMPIVAAIGFSAPWKSVSERPCPSIIISTRTNFANWYDTPKALLIPSVFPFQPTQSLPAYPRNSATKS